MCRINFIIYGIRRVENMNRVFHQAAVAEVAEVVSRILIRWIFRIQVTRLQIELLNIAWEVNPLQVLSMVFINDTQRLSGISYNDTNRDWDAVYADVD